MKNGLANKTKNLDNGFFDGWAGAALGGALSGGVASAMAGADSSHLPSANLDLGGPLNNYPRCPKSNPKLPTTKLIEVPRCPKSNPKLPTTKLIEVPPLS
jgi:hypothetical protein